MTEVELKILEIDSEAMQKRLLELGAMKTFEGDMQASLYDFPNGKLHTDTSFVRLRTKGEKVELAFKKAIKSSVAMIYDEQEVVVSSREEAHRILESIGLVVTVQGRRKHRISYSLGDTHFELDTIEGIPTYLEIEVQDVSHLQAAVSSLGIDEGVAKPLSSKEVYSHYGIE